MKIRCCRCKKDLGEKEPLEDESISDTLCDTCCRVEIDKELEKIDKINKKIEKENETWTPIQ